MRSDFSLKMDVALYLCLYLNIILILRRSLVQNSTSDGVSCEYLPKSINYGTLYCYIYICTLALVRFVLLIASNVPTFTFRHSCPRRYVLIAWKVSTRSG